MKARKYSCAVKHTLFALMMVILLPLAARAAGPETPGGIALEFSGAAIKRGEEVFKSSCQNCHSLKYSGYKARMTAEDIRSDFGKEPPDLNLIARARGRGVRGSEYIYSLLVGYNGTPEKNTVFRNIAMPPPLSKDDPQLMQKARDVSAFLFYAADPSANERRGMGRYVLGYMIVLTILLYFLNRKAWKGIKKKSAGKRLE